MHVSPQTAVIPKIVKALELALHPDTGDGESRAAFNKARGMMEGARLSVAELLTAASASPVYDIVRDSLPGVVETMLKQYRAEIAELQAENELLRGLNGVEAFSKLSRQLSKAREGEARALKAISAGLGLDSVKDYLGQITELEQRLSSEAVYRISREPKLNARIAELEAEIAAKPEAVAPEPESARSASLKRQLTATRAELDALTDAAADQSASMGQLASLSSRVSELEGELAKARSDVGRANDFIDRLSDKLAAADSSIQAAMAERDAWFFESGKGEMVTQPEAATASPEPVAGAAGETAPPTHAEPVQPAPKPSGKRKGKTAYYRYYHRGRLRACEQYAGQTVAYVTSESDYFFDDMKTARAGFPDAAAADFVTLKPITEAQYHEINAAARKPIAGKKAANASAKPASNPPAGKPEVKWRVMVARIVDLIGEEKMLTRAEIRDGLGITEADEDTFGNALKLGVKNGILENYNGSFHVPNYEPPTKPKGGKRSAPLANKGETVKGKAPSEIIPPYIGVRANPVAWRYFKYTFKGKEKTHCKETRRQIAAAVISDKGVIRHYSNTVENARQFCDRHRFHYRDGSGNDVYELIEISEAEFLRIGGGIQNAR